MCTGLQGHLTGSLRVYFNGRLPSTFTGGFRGGILRGASRYFQRGLKGGYLKEGLQGTFRELTGGHLKVTLREGLRGGTLRSP